MSWSTYVTDIRTLISDGATDKFRYLKKVIGRADGSNLNFKTFETRRISAFISPTSPAGVFVNGVLVTVTAEDLTSGIFTLQTAPNDGDSVEACYYIQWFTDAEITQFATKAAEWILGIEDPTQITSDLLPAAKEYAAGCAFQKLSLKFAENLAEQYQLYDAPDKQRFNPVTAYMGIAEKKFKLAFELRDDVYENRKGQAKAPIFRTIGGAVKDVPPNA